MTRSLWQMWQLLPERAPDWVSEPSATGGAFRAARAAREARLRSGRADTERAGSAAAPFLGMKAMQTVGPLTSGLFTNLSPLITAAIAVAYLGESLERFHVIGAALIIGSVMLAQTEMLRQST